MSANPEANRVTDDLFGGEDRREHSPEPWRQEGRYLRDATGAIVVRGRSSADARRIAAAINGVRGIPTEVLESWRVEDVSDPSTRPDFEVELGEDVASPHEVRPPSEEASSDLSFPLSPPGFPIEKAFPYDRRVAQRRQAERRQKDRRAS
ncbi:MAG TPA: hypothetical protein VMQ61_10110 [Thermoanaerobaculia bacterium]|nr:hypothetical protein [Thermoanaerobaculia bacterium]